MSDGGGAKKQDPNAGDSRVAGCRSQKNIETRFGAFPRSSERHADGTSRLARYDFLAPPD